MKRRSYSGSEYDQLQRLKSENRKLRQQISQLRKQISRIDIDRFQNLKDLLDAQDREEQEQAAQEQQKTLERQWACWECGQGTMRLVVLERRDGVHYYRCCDNCKKRTKLQKYNDKVEGVK
jgi:septal ring factor EnvC (AmiA/AmiB activator)